MGNYSYLCARKNFGGEPQPLKCGKNFIPPLWFSLFTRKDLFEHHVECQDEEELKYPAFKADKAVCLKQLASRRAFFESMKDPDVLAVFNAWEKFVVGTECLELVLDPSEVAMMCEVDELHKYLEAGMLAMDGSREDWENLFDGTVIEFEGGRLVRRLSPKEDGYFVGFDV